MHVAEELYTKGFISYPRTETESFSRDADLRSLIAEQGRHPAWGAFARELVGGREEEGGQHGRDSGAGKFRFPRKGSKDDQAHPPIHPTKLATSQELKGTDEQVGESVLCVAMTCRACLWGVLPIGWQWWVCAWLLGFSAVLSSSTTRPTRVIDGGKES